MISDIELFSLAKKAANNAYCSYSKFPVGACALYESGNYYTGCNVENSSYGLSLCAERNAMSSAVNSGEKSKLIKIAVFSPEMPDCYPCGACRQWIKEFCDDINAEIILENKDGLLYSLFINDILPYSFNLS